MRRWGALAHIVIVSTTVRARPCQGRRSDGRDDGVRMVAGSSAITSRRTVIEVVGTMARSITQYLPGPPSSPSCRCRSPRSSRLLLDINHVVFGAKFAKLLVSDIECGGQLY